MAFYDQIVYKCKRTVTTGQKRGLTGRLTSQEKLTGCRSSILAQPMLLSLGGQSQWSHGTKDFWPSKTRLSMSSVRGKNR